MATPISLKYIETAMKRGESKEKIKHLLKMQGISEVEIEQAFQEYEGRGSESTSPVSPNQGESAGGPMFRTEQSAIPTSGQVSQQTVPPKTQVNSQKFVQPQQTIPQPPTTSRLQYAPKKSKAWIVWLVIIWVLLVGAGLAYNYFDQIYGFIFTEKETQEEAAPAEVETYVRPTTSTTTESGVSVATTTTTATTTAQRTEPVVVDKNLEKVANISKIKIILDSYFSTNGVYPKIADSAELASELAKDTNSFYCYRKEGKHFVVGTTLGSDADELKADLDGSYYCGDAVKECADPVYCVGADSK